jgi:CDP-glucose 4,6-dehydratase
MFTNIYHGKKVLVTGHTGFKGSWLVAWLQLLGAEVVGLALKPNTEPAHFNLLNLDMQSHFIDIRDEAKVAAIIKNVQPDILFHLAAQPLVRDSYELPLDTFAINVMGTANVLNACRMSEKLKGILVVSSDKCYENREWVWGYRENDPMGGHDPYSASKGCTELVTACFRNSYFNLEKFGQDHQVLLASARAGNVIGGGDWAKDRLIPDMMRSIATNEKVLIRNPQATRPWQHVLECLSGYLLLGEKLLKGEKQFAEGWNFAPNQASTTPVIKIVEQIKKLWPKLDYEINISTKPLHEAHLLKLDSSKANALLGWNNIWDLDTTVSKTIEWYRNFYQDQKLLTHADIEEYINDLQGNNNE